MITCCPQCTTRFRITPEQLAARQGVVRCGKCGLVFNAFEQVHPDELEKETRALSSGQAGADDAAASESLLHADRLTGHIERACPPPSWAPALDTVIDPTTDDALGTLGERPSFAQFHLLPGNIHAHPPSPVWTPALDDTPSSPSEPPLLSDGPSNQACAEFAASLESPETEENASSPQQIDLDFRPAPVATRAESFLFRPDLIDWPMPRRIALIGATSLLSLALVAQLILLFRTEIAANWPELKPYLVSACGLLGCAVPLPRHIDNLSIEASELQADAARSNVVLVTAILRNRGATVEAYPTLEITFTDTLDRPIAKRSLDAVDYLAQRPGKDEGIAAAGEAVAKAAIETIDLKPSGYRLRLYYR